MENRRSALGISHSLTDKEKVPRLQAYQEFIQFLNDDHTLLDSMVMGDETYCFKYDPQTCL
jgi:hypothetical protein